MAEIVLSSIAEGIIGTLRSAAVQEIALLWGVNHELSQLEETISTIKAVLVDAEEKQIHNHQIRTWLERLEDVVCEADDLMDEFNTEAALQRQRMVFGSEMTNQVCTFFSASNQIAFRHRLGHRIKAIKERLRKIRDDKGFHLEVRHEETNRVVIWGREATHSYVPEQEVIGRDRDKMAIIECLLDAKINEGNDVSVFPIIGNGGIGKTTLAQLVFNDEKVKKHFDLRLWVCVSNDFNVRLLVEKIIKSATDKGLENLEMDQLQKMLQKEINGKRYLLVLDDVWNEDRELWLKLKILLSNCVNGSRIVVTSRSKVVGEIMSTEEPYILGRLDKDKSWALFKKVAFKHGEEPSNCKIMEIGKEIVEKCGGIPLAIRSIGRMLYYKDPATQWSSCLEMEFSRISQNANDILPTLKLSYDNLPSHLKHCFTFCKIFPKGHEIKVDMLIDLWMALGYVKSSVSTKLLDMGNEYFTDLLCRSFFQDLQDDGKIKKCKMHDLMHDLATQVGGADFAFLQQNKKSNFNKNTRHVSFNFHIDSSQQIPTTLSQENKIRTILLLGQSSSVIPGRRGHSVCDAVVSSLKLVRILNLNNSGIKIVPNCISKLKHLRYLDLSLNEDIKRLPDSITKLYNLQTLRLSYCKKLQELPRDIKKLVNLVNLHLHGCSGLTHMPCGLDQLTNLQTLSQFVLKNGTSSMPKHGGEAGELSDLMGLNNLRRHFGISNLGNGEDTRTANLKAKQHLHSLVLSWHADPLYLKLDDLDYWSAKFDDAPFYLKEVDYEGTLEGLQPHPNLKFLTLLHYEGVRFSSWLPSLTNLEYFCVEHSRKCHYLPPLNQFLSLKVLELRNVLSLEYISNDSSMSSLTILPSLETLRFERLPNLKGWWREEEVVDDEEDNNSFIGLSSRSINQSSPSFPRLSKLVIYGCPKLNFLPLSPNLKSLTVENNNWKLLQHVMRRPQIQKMVAEASFSSSPSSSSSSSTPFSNLTALVLWNIEDLHSLPEWLKNLTSLQSLGIMYCYNLKCLSPGIQHLASSLQVLSIKGCKGLDMSDADGFTWLGLKSLCSLNLKKLPQLKTFPEGLQHVTSLQLLKVEGCENMIGIPEWISNLKSLQMLKIIGCPKLTSLPQGVHKLTSLQKLVIEDCPILSKRCQMKIGKDWPKVAHIPQLILKSTSGYNWKVFKNCWMPQLCNKRWS